MLSALTAVSLLSFSAQLGCSAQEEEEPTLLFASGFEGGVQIVDGDWPDYENIVGPDSETGFEWPIDILGSSEAGLHYIDDDGRSRVQSVLQTVTGHDGTPTRALYSAQQSTTGATQCPYEILDLSEGESDLYVRYWLKLDSASFEQADSWRALFEWKSLDYAEGSGFRLIGYIYTDAGGDPYWHFQGDADPESPIWEIDNRDLPVPLEQWLLMEYSWHWSTGDDGWARWRVNGELVGEHQGATTRRRKPIDFIMLTQIYGDSNPKFQWVDDFEIWSSEPTEAQRQAGLETAGR